MKIIEINGKKLCVINVPDDGYRETLAQNPNLTNRYGFLEVTSRTTGLDSRYRIHNIEQFEIVGMYADDSTEEIMSHLNANNCFEESGKVVVLKCVIK